MNDKFKTSAMRDYIFVKGAYKTFFTAANLSAAYKMLRTTFGDDTGWTWQGTNAL